MATAEDIASIVGQQLNAQQRAMEERFQELLTAQREAFQTQLGAAQEFAQAQDTEGRSLLEQRNALQTQVAEFEARLPESVQVYEAQWQRLGAAMALTGAQAQRLEGRLGGAAPPHSSSRFVVRSIESSAARRVLASLLVGRFRRLLFG